MPPTDTKRRSGYFRRTLTGLRRGGRRLVAGLGMGAGTEQDAAIPPDGHLANLANNVSAEKAIRARLFASTEETPDSEPPSSAQATTSATSADTGQPPWRVVAVDGSTTDLPASEHPAARQHPNAQLALTVAAETALLDQTAAGLDIRQSLGDWGQAPEPVEAADVGEDSVTSLMDQPLPSPRLAPNGGYGCPGGSAEESDPMVLGLDRLIDAWPDLPLSVRQAMLAMLDLVQVEV